MPCMPSMRNTCVAPCWVLEKRACQSCSTWLARFLPWTIAHFHATSWNRWNSQHEKLLEAFPLFHHPLESLPVTSSSWSKNPQSISYHCFPPKSSLEPPKKHSVLLRNDHWVFPPYLDNHIKVHMVHYDHVNPIFSNLDLPRHRLTVVIRKDPLSSEAPGTCVWSPWSTMHSSYD